MRRHEAAETMEHAITRAAGYELLAKCFAYPDDSALDAMREAAAAGGHLLAGGPLHALLEALATAQQASLERDYAAVFTLTTSPDCPTFETAYVCRDPAQQTSRMADINGFYRSWGVDASGTSFRPDDISVELEFMAFLCRKEAYAAVHMGAPRAGQAARAGRLFLSRHLGRWAPALAAATGRTAPGGSFHALLGEALEAWIAGDIAASGAKVDDAAERPQLPWPDRSERGGMLPGPATIISAEDVAEVR